jgi:hypothetical protein
MRKTALLALLRKEPAYVEQALELCTSDQKPQAWRAAWLLHELKLKDDVRLLQRIPKILEVLPHREDGHQRELLRLLELLPLSESEESCLFDCSLTLWEDVSKSASLRITAFKALTRIAEKYPELRGELTFLTEEHFTESLSPGIKRSFERLSQVLNNRH